MGIVKITEADRTSANVGRDLVHTFTRHFKVKCTPPTGDDEVLQHPAIPKPFEPHPDFPAALVDTVDVDRGNGRLFSVTVNYSTKIEQDERKDNPANPLNRPAKIPIHSVKERVIVTTDWKGNPLVNTAGDLLVGIEEEETLWQISIEKNVPAVPAWILNYANAINKDPIRIRGITWPARTLKVDDLEIPEPEIENDVEYVRLRLRLLYREKGWQRVFLNYGRRELVKAVDPSTGDEIETLQPILVGSPEKPTDEPLPLDENGRAYREPVKLSDGSTVEVVKLKVDAADIKRNLIKAETKPVLPFSRLPTR